MAESGDRKPRITVRSYYRSVVGRAGRETKEFVAARLVWSILGILVTYGLGVLAGRAVDAKTVTTLILYPLATLGIVALVVFGGQLVRAPVRLARERAVEEAVLKSENAELAAQPRPHLVFTGTEAARAGSAARIGGTVVVATDTNHHVRVQVANDPGEKLGECARSAVPWIAFLDDADQPLIPELIGRWAGAPQPAETGRLGLPPEEQLQRDLKANGQPYSIDIAMKTPADAHFYAFNDKNYQAAGLKLDTHRIDVVRCRVRVSVRADNARITQMFVLHNDGVGGALRLEKLRSENQETTVTGESRSELGEDRQVGMETDPIESTDSERE